MKDEGSEPRTRSETDPEALERLLADVREMQHMTRTAGWSTFFGALQQAAVDAARNMLTEENPVRFFRYQATLAFAHAQVAALRQPFEDLTRLHPEHPEAGQDLPCAIAFEEAVDLSVNVRKHASAVIENDRRSSAALLQRALAALNSHERVGEDEPDSCEGDAYDEEGMDRAHGNPPGGSPDRRDVPPAAAPTPTTGKFKHPWRELYLGRK
jgi:hypothetical protein